MDSESGKNFNETILQAEMTLAAKQELDRRISQAIYTFQSEQVSPLDHREVIQVLCNLIQVIANRSIAIEDVRTRQINDVYAANKKLQAKLEQYERNLNSNNIHGSI